MDFAEISEKTIQTRTVYPTWRTTMTCHLDYHKLKVRFGLRHCIKTLRETPLLLQSIVHVKVPPSALCQALVASCGRPAELLSASSFD